MKRVAQRQEYKASPDRDPLSRFQDSYGAMVVLMFQKLPGDRRKKCQAISPKSPAQSGKRYTYSPLDFECMADGIMLQYHIFGRSMERLIWTRRRHVMTISRRYVCYPYVHPILNFCSTSAHNTIRAHRLLRTGFERAIRSTRRTLRREVASLTQARNPAQ
jgi:hypothetical protein